MKRTATVLVGFRVAVHEKEHSGWVGPDTRHVLHEHVAELGVADGVVASQAAVREEKITPVSREARTFRRTNVI